MKLQVIQDSNGKPTGVFIPIKDWNMLKAKYQALEELEYEEPTREQLLGELKEAFQELKLIEAGKRKARPARELLEEL